jgi:hypothetical protein
MYGSLASLEEVRMTKLIKTLTAVAAASTLSAAVLVTPTQPAQARGGAVAAGIIGGLAAGAIIGGAAAHGGPGYYYGPGPVYYGPRCYWHGERFWDGWGWRVRRVRVCD